LTAGGCSCIAVHGELKRDEGCWSLLSACVSLSLALRLSLSSLFFFLATLSSSPDLFSANLSHSDSGPEFRRCRTISSHSTLLIVVGLTHSKSHKRMSEAVKDHRRQPLSSGSLSSPFTGEPSERRVKGSRYPGHRTLSRCVHRARDDEHDHYLS